MEYNKEQLVKLILEDKLPYTKIGTMLGVSDVSVRRAAKKIGIELPKRKQKMGEKFCEYCGKQLTKRQILSGNIYCSQKCDIDRKYEESINLWKQGENNGYNGNDKQIKPFIKRYLQEKYNNSCEVCGYNEVNPFTGKSILQVHHIDGDCTNNEEENLQLLCPNCHAKTENYGGRNKNSKRHRKVYHNNK